MCCFRGKASEPPTFQEYPFTNQAVAKKKANNIEGNMWICEAVEQNELFYGTGIHLPLLVFNTQVKHLFSIQE